MFSLPGSSPRVRGTLPGISVLLLFARFIPACAGNALQVPDRSPELTVHPRVCGERQNDLVQEIRHAGSSPRVRGTPL